MSNMGNFMEARFEQEWYRKNVRPSEKIAHEWGIPLKTYYVTAALYHFEKNDKQEWITIFAIIAYDEYAIGNKHWFTLKLTDEELESLKEFKVIT